MNPAITSYPLVWPVQWPRTEHPVYSRFDTSLSRAGAVLIKELELLGARDIVISSNAELNKSGNVASRQRVIEDTGVAVYFVLEKQQRCMPCDKWVYIADNLHAIELSVAALRSLERWGSQGIVSAAWQGFAALPEGSGENWWDVLEVNRDAPVDIIDHAYRRLARVYHPDKGGTEAEFRRIAEAYFKYRGAK